MEQYDIVFIGYPIWWASIPMPVASFLEEYEHFLKRIIHLIRQNGAQIVFATTTPFYEAGEAKDNTGTGAFFTYHNDQVVRYNEAACKIMVSEGIPVNDLYTLCLKGPRYYKCEDMLHLTEDGYWEVARQTAECIRKLL